MLGALALGGVAILGTLYIAISDSAITSNDIRKAKNDKELKYSSNILQEVKRLEKARTLYFEIYHKYPISVDELITKGLLPGTFKNQVARYSKDISLVNGKIVVTNSDIKTSNMLISKADNIKSTSNKEQLRSQKNIKKTDSITGTVLKTKHKTNREINLVDDFKDQVAQKLGTTSNNLTSDNVITNIDKEYFSDDSNSTSGLTIESDIGTDTLSNDKIYNHTGTGW
jgi:hypothetical protein